MVVEEEEEEAQGIQGGTAAADEVMGDALGQLMADIPPLELIHRLQPLVTSTSCMAWHSMACVDDLKLIHRLQPRHAFTMAVWATYTI